MIEREWISLLDPEDPHNRYIFDLTFLLSGYRCIYGRGCPGTGEKDDPATGCCAHGAHYVDADDEARVKRVARQLGRETFDHAVYAARHGVSATVPGGDRRTRVVQGACVFLNRGDKPGCALHQLAVADGVHPMTYKPEVCWIVPLRRDVHTDTADDGQPRITTTITSFDRGAWGPGGAEFEWWCTESPEAYIGDTPVYQSMAAEITGMTSPAVYAELCAELDSRANGAALRRLPVVLVR